MALYRTMDIGGGTGRKATVEVDAQRRVHLKTTQAEAKRFNGGQELIELCDQTLTAKKLAAEQSRVVVSLAGPVDTATGTIIKLTNQTGIEETNILLGQELETRLKASTGRQIAVDLINDGTAGTYAELSPQGALANLPNGSLAIALIIGNGIGGGLNKINGPELVSVPGAHELGHFQVPLSLLERQQLVDLLPAEIKCGCQTTWRQGSSLGICLDAAAKGPTMQAVFRSYLAAVVESAPSAPGLRQILDVVRDGRDMTDEAALGQLTNMHITQVLRDSDGRNVVCREVISKQAALLAYRLAAMQQNFNDIGQIHVALIGGVGIGWGTTLVEGINAEFDRMSTAEEMFSVWSMRPDVRVGAFPSDETNLYGNIFYMLSHEA